MPLKKHAYFVFTLASILGSTAGLSVVKEPIIKPWIRLDGGASNIKLSPKSNFISFTDEDGKNLRILSLKNHNVSLVSSLSVGMSHFWAPDGLRLFFREMSKTENTADVTSAIKAYDTLKAKIIVLDQIQGLTGFINFDPRDLRLQYLSKKGLHTKKLVFPDERLARWQIAQKSDFGRWHATPQGMLWLSDGGYSMQKMKDDQERLQSFDISPDGKAAVWANESGNVFLSILGQDPQLIGKGTDPKWHPQKEMIVYSAAKVVGTSIVDYDLKIFSTNGDSRYITHTQSSQERWPIWEPDGKTIIFTRKDSTDLFRIVFEEKL